jgi:hypothetical protein
MAIEYVGAAYIEIDGVEVEVESVTPKRSTMRKLVKTMNKTGRAKGFARLVEEISLTVSLPAKLEDTRDWAAVENAKVTVRPLIGGKATSYLDCFVTSVGRAYKTDSEMMFDIELAALREVTE